ncbi:hypothetical protein [Dyadobacter sp. CY326]|uniref:hypothetical protein n=1 Tax=Dyadobacter sp. CY326 TaxID=2907300 RepID=UPI001F3D6E5A|nr:hypothetical protein [Dyadobacter sp. CY326]MCE7067650.1 hypothetical protein [Dyadobacter sp. CY326]
MPTVRAQRVINQTMSFMLAIMLLMAAGMRSWSDQSDFAQKQVAHAKAVGKDFTKKNASQSTEQSQAKVSALSLDAVITPALSFDFSHYFYFLPQPIWHFVVKESVVSVVFKESVFPFSYFHRIFGRFIVTNAP